MGVSALLALGLVGGAAAHRLDEYLQATLIGVTRDGIDVEIHLTPGVAMLPVFMAVIDQDGDGRISPAEERTYAARVAREVELRVDGAQAPLSLIESTFPTSEAMREGLGTIRIRLRAARNGHELRFENRHLPQVSAYLVNCLAAPSDGLVVGRQKRDEAQRTIEFAYSFGAGAVAGPRAAWIALGPLWPAAIGMLLAARMAVLIYRAKHDRRALKFQKLIFGSDCSCSDGRGGSIPQSSNPPAAGMAGKCVARETLSARSGWLLKRCSGS